MANFNVTYSYPNNDIYDYIVRLKRLNLDEEKDNDIANNRGFIIKSPQPIKKELKNEDGIYSSKFGATMQDLNAFSDRYKCSCGATKERINHGTLCPKCGTEVKYVDDDFGYFGWIVLDEYYLIHPGLYKSICFLIGEKKLLPILDIQEDVDQDGNPVERVVNLDEPFKGIGMIGFYERFDEILDFYAKKNPNKEKYYLDIKKERKKVFTHSIPVYTTYLRPFNVDGENFTFEATNATFNIISQLANRINKRSTKLYQQKKPKDRMLFKLQMKWNELYASIEQIISGKAGSLRNLIGGRCNFTSRSVIVPNNNLRIDEVTLPYKCCMGLLKLPIINIIQTSYNIGYDQANMIWENAFNSDKVDPTMMELLKSIIHDPNKYGGRGLPVIINRNPTISFGSMFQMYCVDVTDTYTMGVPLQVLVPLAADFDGDVLNILWIFNDEFYEQACKIFNPRNAFYISHNDGKFNNDVNHSKDTIINLNTFMGMGRSNYSPEQIKFMETIKSY